MVSINIKFENKFIYYGYIVDTLHTEIIRTVESNVFMEAYEILRQDFPRAINIVVMTGSLNLSLTKFNSLRFVHDNNKLIALKLSNPTANMHIQLIDNDRIEMHILV